MFESLKSLYSLFAKSVGRINPAPLGLKSPESEFRNYDQYLGTGQLKIAFDFYEKGDKWNCLIALLQIYEENKGIQHVNQMILELIGTTTPIAQVFASMNAEFDEKFYNEKYEDVRNVTNDFHIHYLLYGWRENRRPSHFFDPVAYKEFFPYLAAAEFPLAHFHTVGRQGNIPGNGISNEIWYEPKCPDLEQWMNLNSAQMNDETVTVVIIPVYIGFDETLSSIFNALRYRNDSKYSVLVINDCSPDENLTAFLERLFDLGLFDYCRNEANIGFVNTVNKAIRSLSSDKDVILLNSDAYVFNDWYERLYWHANKAGVATVCPLSNCATICSYPVKFDINNAKLELSVDELDFLTSKVNKGVSIELPTGVGFCLFIKRSVLQQLGDLDDTFGLGYGEETDFCIRASLAGYKNILASDVFVYHIGSVSFGTKKFEELRSGTNEINSRYPHYESMLMNHNAVDPELFVRRKLDAARLELFGKNAFILISHNLGGGIETYLEEFVADLDQKKILCILLRVHSRSHVTVEVAQRYKKFFPNLKNIDLKSDWSLFCSMILNIQSKHFYINSFVGLDWVYTEKICNLILSCSIPFTVIGHDYSFITQFYTLLRPDNVFVGIPDLSLRKKWQESYMITNNDGSDEEQRHRFFDNFLRNAFEVSVPSVAAANVYQENYPDLQISVRPHDNHLPKTRIASRRPKGNVRKIAVVGAIGPHKGSQVILALSSLAKQYNKPISFHIIGYTDCDDLLKQNGVEITGKYSSELEAISLLEAIRPDLIFIPSIWPETFCYTLSFALTLKIPPVVFDVGAQAERVNEIDWGVTLPISIAYDTEHLIEKLLAINLLELWRRRPL